MKYIKSLKCRECKRDYSINPFHVCEFCFGPLETVLRPQDQILSWPLLRKESSGLNPRDQRPLPSRLPLGTQQAEGISTETAGGVTVGLTKKLIEKGIIPRDESILISITGNGLKTQEAIQDRVGQPLIIEAKFSEFEKIVTPKQKRHREASIQATI